MIPLRFCAGVFRLGFPKLLGNQSSLTTSLINGAPLPVRSFSVGVVGRMAPASVVSSSLPALTPTGCHSSIGAYYNNGSCGGLFSQIRTIIRNNFPVPKEQKRRRLGWKHRMSTKGGRAVIMRRILKGRHILTH